MSAVFVALCCLAVLVWMMPSNAQTEWAVNFEHIGQSYLFRYAHSKYRNNSINNLSPVFKNKPHYVCR